MRRRLPTCLSTSSARPFVLVFFSNFCFFISLVVSCSLKLMGLCCDLFNSIDRCYKISLFGLQSDYPSMQCILGICFEKVTQPLIVKCTYRYAYFGAILGFYSHKDSVFSPFRNFRYIIHTAFYRAKLRCNRIRNWALIARHNDRQDTSSHPLGIRAYPVLLRDMGRIHNLDPCAQRHFRPGKSLLHACRLFVSPGLLLLQKSGREQKPSKMQSKKIFSRETSGCMKCYYIALRKR